VAFIVIEGGDGAGKSTQAKLLAQRLKRRDYPALLTHEPGGTPLGESLRRLLKTQREISPLSELLMFVAARNQLVDKIIRPALASGTTVVSDRFAASSVAYQGYGRGLDLLLIDKLNRSATKDLLPDLTVLLDLPVEAALNRKGNNGGDNFDSAPQQFHERVRQGYLAQAAQDPDRWLVLDATQPPRRTSQEVWAKVQPLL
jgi:dTMP kinase